MKPSVLGLVFISIAQASARLRPRLWRWWYDRLAQRDSAGQLLFMNYGYSGADAAALPLNDVEEPFRYCMQLYQRVLRGVELHDKAVLEVGCGRGGGGRFVVRHYAPRSYLGVDLSAAAIRWCEQQPALIGASWRQGSADALPVADHSMEVVVNVESSHCYPSFAAFTAEVWRVLTPGGCLAMCDLRNAAQWQEVEHIFRTQGWQVQVCDDITAGVLQALDAVSIQRNQQISMHVPRWLRPAFHDFVATQGSVIYQMLRTRELMYWCYRLMKPHKVAEQATIDARGVR